MTLYWSQKFHKSKNIVSLIRFKEIFKNDNFFIYFIGLVMVTVSFDVK